MKRFLGKCLKTLCLFTKGVVSSIIVLGFIILSIDYFIITIKHHIESGTILDYVFVGVLAIAVLFFAIERVLKPHLYELCNDKNCCK